MNPAPLIDPFVLVATSESVSTGVSTGITLLFAGLLVALIVCLAFEEKLHAKKSIIAGTFAILCLFLGTATQVLTFRDVVVGSYPARVVEPAQLELVDDETGKPIETVTVEVPTESESNEAGSVLHFGGHELSMPAYIPGIDWSVIAIILGSSLFVDVTSRSGLFTWIAIRATKLSAGDPRRLLFFYGVMTVVFSAVLNNVTAMIIVGSLTVVSLTKLERQHQIMPFLLIEGLLTNIGGLLTLISSVPNIIIGTTAHISFASFLLKSLPYVTLATIATLWLSARMFKIRSLEGEIEKIHARELVAGFDENDGIGNRTFFRVSVFMLAAFILLIAGASALPVINHLGMGFVALSMAAAMLLMFRWEVDKFYRAVDWDLIGFFMALFVVIYVMEEAQVLHWIGLGLQSVMGNMDAESAHPIDAMVLLLGSAGFSSVTDNIPLSAMLASILHEFGTPESSGLWWSVIFGANLGGNLTPIGSASTLVAVTIMHKHGIQMSFIRFLKLAAVFAAAQIALAIAYVILVIPLIPDL